MGTLRLPAETVSFVYCLCGQFQATSLDLAVSIFKMRKNIPALSTLPAVMSISHNTSKQSLSVSSSPSPSLPHPSFQDPQETTGLLRLVKEEKSIGEVDKGGSKPWGQ